MPFYSPQRAGHHDKVRKKKGKGGGGGGGQGEEEEKEQEVEAEDEEESCCHNNPKVICFYSTQREGHLAKKKTSKTNEKEGVCRCLLAV